MIAPVLWQYLWRQLTQNVGRTALTVLGVALGVAITLAIQLTNHTAIRQFEHSVDLVTGHASASIVPTTTRFLDESILFDLSPIWEAGGQFTPVLDVSAIWVKPDQPPTPNTLTISGTPIRVLGVDMMVDARFRPLEFLRPPADLTQIFQADASLTPPVYVPERLAQEHHITINTPITLLIGSQQKTVMPVGILKNQGVGQAYGGDVVVMDMANAQRLTGHIGQISRVDIQSPPKVGDAGGWSQQFEHTIQHQLPSGAALSSVADQTGQGQKLLAAFQTNLTALSLIGLVVGMFLMYNTMSIAILRRQKDIGILRTLALTRQAIGQLFLVELLIYGTLGSALGCILGMMMATFTTRLVAQTIHMLYTGLPMHQVTWSWPWIGAVFVLGVCTTVVSGVIPLWQSTRIPPALAARPTARELNNNFGWCALLALLCWAIAAWASQQPAVYGLPVWGHVCSFALLVGAAFFVPLALPWGLRLFRHCFSVTEVRIAASQLLLHRGRTSVAVASLMMAVAMVMSIGIMIHSFRETVVLWVNQSITADIWVKPSGPHQVEKPYLDPGLVLLFKTIHSIEAVDPFLEQPIQFRGQPTRLAVGDFTVFEALGNLQFLSGRSAREVMRDAIAHDGVVITEPFANRFSLKRGDTMRLSTSQGERHFPIMGVYRDYASEQGFVVMNRTTYRQFFPPGDELTGIAVYAKPGVDVTQLRRKMIAALPDNASVSVQTQTGLKHEVLTIFDQTFAITHALHLISVIVAILAIMNTLISLMLELKREFELMHMIGFSQRAILGVQWAQAMWIGLLSSVLALPVGVVLSWILVFVINVQAFHWTIDYHCPPLFLFETVLAVIVVSALVGGIAPWYLKRRLQAKASERRTV